MAGRDSLGTPVTSSGVAPDFLRSALVVGFALLIVAGIVVGKVFGWF